MIKPIPPAIMPYPACALHDEDLKEMKEIMLDVQRQMIELKSMAGPLATHDKQISVLELSDRRAHERITHLRIDFKELAGEQSKLILKVGLILTPLAAAVGAFIGRYM